jgi:hypothetical protein
MVVLEEGMVVVLEEGMVVGMGVVLGASSPSSLFC